jgi:hypothetical protein
VVELPDRTRRGSRGKLAAVLDHTLRLGDAETQEKVIEAHKARGLTPPEHLTDPPKIELRFLIYWEAFQDLQTARVNPRGMIPIGAILDYALRYQIDPDTLKRIVWKTDRILLDHWKGVDKAEKAQAQAERDNKASLGSGART